jgi:hypothetical protein
MTLPVTNTDSIASFKTLIYNHCGIPPAKQRLSIHGGGRFPFGNANTLASVGLRPGTTVSVHLSINGGADPKVALLFGFVVFIIPAEGVTASIPHAASGSSAHIAGGTFVAVELGASPIVYGGARAADAVNALRRAAGANGRMSLPNTVQSVPVQWLRGLLLLPAAAFSVRGGQPKAYTLLLRIDHMHALLCARPETSDLWSVPARHFTTLPQLQAVSAALLAAAEAMPAPVVAPSSPDRAAGAGTVPPPTPERIAAFHDHIGARRADARMRNDDNAAHDASPQVREWLSYEARGSLQPVTITRVLVFSPAPLQGQKVRPLT